MKQSLKEGQNPTLRGLCEGRENRGSGPIGEASDSVRGLTRDQYPSRVNGTQYEGWLKAWSGTGWIVVANKSQKRSKHRPTWGLGTEAQTECRGLPERCVKVREVPAGSNMH